LKEASAGARPLEGLTVVVTGSRRASELAKLVSNFGGTPYVVPTVGIAPTADDSEVGPFLRSVIGGADYSVFMTGPGVQTVMLSAERLGKKEELVTALKSGRTAVVARSGKPKGVLAKLGIKVDLMPPLDRATAEGIVEILKGRGVKGKTVAILWHGSRDGWVREELEKAGATEVVECSVYRYSHELDSKGAGVLGSLGFEYKAPSHEAVVRLVHEISRGERAIDAVTFTSPPAARNLFETAEETGMERELRDALNRKIVVAVGPSTREAVEENGVRVQVMPRLPGMGAMVTALADHVTGAR